MSSPTTTAAVPAVELTGIGKSFGKEVAVRDVSLAVAPGELISLLGASGSGKSTLLRLVAGFERPTTGSIRLAGRDVSSLSPADREIGMVFQNYALFPHLTVAKNVEYGLRMRGWKGARRSERVAEMLERMRLEKFGSRLPSQLSGGQQQRVAIARALAYSPSLMLMDEPLGALDKALKQDLLLEIRRVHREFNTTILYVTHDREEALTLSDRVALMQDSRLVTCEPVQDLYLRPPTAFAASFFSGSNLIPVTIAARGSEIIGTIGGLDRPVNENALAVDGPALAVVSPREIRLHASVDDWSLPARVIDVVFLGDDVQVKAELVGSGLGHVTVTALVAHSAAVGLSAGAEVVLGVGATSARFVPDSIGAHR